MLVVINTLPLIRIHYKILARLIGISIILSHSQTAKAICSNNQVDEIAKKITVLIDSRKPGSGVIIQKKGSIYSVLTAYHVVKDRNLKYEILTPDKQRYQLNYQTVRPLNNNIDLAVLQFTSTSNYQVAKIVNYSTVKRQTSVYVAGFPFKTANVRESVYDCRDGKVIDNSNTASADTGYTLIYDNPTLPGMSGGAVLNQQGQVIGIHGQGEAVVLNRDPIDPSIGTVLTGRNSGIPSSLFLPLLDRIGVHVSSPTSTIPTAGNIDRLDELLSQSNWKEADEETKSIILTISQASSVLNEQAIYRLSCQTLSHINQSWKNKSEGRFGFAIQVQKWKNLFGSKFEPTNENFETFATELGWRYRGVFLHNNQINYSSSAPPGHLPRAFLDEPIWGKFIAYLDGCKI